MGASLLRVIAFHTGLPPRFALAATYLLVALTVTPTLVVAQQAPETVLVDVNGEVITVADMDAMVMTDHRTGNLSLDQQPDFRVLLEKRIKDILVLQDAWGMGMNEEPELLAKVDETLAQRAMRGYVKDNLVLPNEANRDSVLAYFDRYYHMIQIRIVSAPTAETAETLREAVLGGADMGALARENSVDSKSDCGRKCSWFRRSLVLPVISPAILIRLLLCWSRRVAPAVR